MVEQSAQQYSAVTAAAAAAWNSAEQRRNAGVSLTVAFTLQITGPLCAVTIYVLSALNGVIRLRRQHVSVDCEAWRFVIERTRATQRRG